MYIICTRYNMTRHNEEIRQVSINVIIRWTNICLNIVIYSNRTGKGNIGIPALQIHKPIEKKQIMVTNCYRGKHTNHKRKTEEQQENSSATKSYPRIHRNELFKNNCHILIWYRTFYGKKVV